MEKVKCDFHQDGSCVHDISIEEQNEKGMYWGCDGTEECRILCGIKDSEGQNVKIIVIEDNDFKYKDIQDILLSLGYKDVVREKSYGSGLRNIVLGDSNYDLLVLDMQLPLYDDEYEIEEDAGISILNELKRKEIAIPTIICSSEKTDIPDVLANIQYNPSVYMKPTFEKVISQITKGETH